MSEERVLDGFEISLDYPTLGNPSGKIYLAYFRRGKRIRCNHLDLDEAVELSRALASASQRIMNSMYEVTEKVA